MTGRAAKYCKYELAKGVSGVSPEGFKIISSGQESVLPPSARLTLIKLVL